MNLLVVIFVVAFIATASAEVVEDEEIFNAVLTVTNSSPTTQTVTLPNSASMSKTFFVEAIQTNMTSFSVEHRITFVVIDGIETISFTLPHLYNETAMIPDDGTSRITLCPKPSWSGEKDRVITVVAQTLSNTPVICRLIVKSTSIGLQLGRENAQILDVSSATPLTFWVNPEADYRDYFVLYVDEVEESNVCMMVAAQSATCPIKNTPDTIQRSEIWQTALRSATITVRARSHGFLEPFFITVIVMPDDTSCRLETSQLFRHQVFQPIRHKKVKIWIEKGQPYTSYIAPIAISMVFMSSIVLISCFIIATKSYEDHLKPEEVSPNGDCSEREEEQQNLTTEFNMDEEEPAYDLFDEVKRAVTDEVLEPNRAKRVGLGLRRFKHRPRVSDLSTISVQDNWFRRNRSQIYIYLLPLVSLFYFVPAFQFVFQAKEKERKTGGQDICFHNFRCSKPFWKYTDFNHVISNVSYLFYGASFMVLVHIKKMKLPPEHHPRINHITSKGIPQQLSIFFSLGFALMAQGVFSICYHFCPTNESLQFDTTMMYVICVLCIIKIYQFRHPDATANAYSTFFFIGLLVLLEATALYNSSWVTFLPFFFVYVGMTIFLAIDFYFLGMGRIDFVLAMLLAKHIIHRCFCIKCKECKVWPIFPIRFVLGIAFCAFNIGYACFSIISKYRHPNKTISHVVLFILVFNLMVYLFYYTIRKLLQQQFCGTRGGFNTRHKCDIFGKKFSVRFSSGMFFAVGAIIFGGLGLYFYKSRTANRNLSPAESRDLNAECGYMGFYDNHDVWHFLGATGVFLAFNSLLTVDDDLLHTERNQIDVF